MRGRFCAAALLCAFAFVAGSSTAVVAKKAPPAPPLSSWPQTHSDIPADPDIMFGILPNGMRYLIRKNTKPEHQVSLRLRVAVGSLEEEDNEEGLAHFLEHMAFRGSKNLADGEVFKTLEALGASRGADTNAFTFPDSTVFVFDIPVNDDAALDKGLMLTHEIATELTLDPKAVDSERAVVLAEARQKDVAAFHASKAYMTQTLSARIADAMTPIGKPDIVQNAPPALLRKFYDTHYRPELTTLVVVGDIDPLAIEVKIKARFFDWKAAAPAVKPPVYAATFGAGLRTKVFSEPGAGTTVTLTWTRPSDLSPDTIAKSERSRLRTIALTVVNQRLQKLVQSAKPPFAGAVATYAQRNNIADTMDMTVSYAPGQALDSLRAAHDVVAEILRNGVRQDEVDQAVSNWRMNYQAWVAAYKTLPSPALAGAYMVPMGTNDVIDSAEEGYAIFESAVKDLHADQITAVLRSLFAGSPSVLISSPTPIEGAEKDVAAIFAQTQSNAQAEQAAPTLVWPYTSFGPPGKVTSQKTIDDLGATFATFANGVRATIKPTKFLSGQVFVSVRFGDGRLAWPKNRKSLIWALGGSFMSGGLTRMSPTDVQRALAGREVNANFNTSDATYDFIGATRPADFESELQFLAAYLTDPAWRPEAFQTAQSQTLTALPQLYATADGMFGMQYWFVAHGSDARWQPPTADEVRATRLEDVKARMQDALKDGPVEVIVVGDIAVEDALKGLQTTFGALAKRRVRTAPTVGDERQPKPQDLPIIVRHQGSGDQAVASIAWRTTSVFPDVQAVRTQQVLERLLAQRLFDELRTHEGMTYTPQTQTADSMATPGWGIIRVFASIPSARIPDFYAAVAKTIADLKTKEVPADELERARGPIVHDVQIAQQNDGYWLTALADAQIDPRQLELIRTHLADLQKVTPADVQRAAQTYLLDSRAWKFLVLPPDKVVAPGAK